MDTKTEENQQMFSALYVVIGVLGVVCNGLTFLTFWKERRRSVFHMQLAVANMISLSSVSFTAPSALRGKWLFGDTVCQWFGFQVFLAGFAEISFTSIICMEMFIAVCCPAKYEKLPSAFFSLTSTGVWIYCLIFSVAPLFGWNRYVVDKWATSCGIDIITHTDSNFSYLATTQFLFVMLAVSAAVCLAFSYCGKTGQSNPFQPILSNTELRKVSVFLFLSLGLSSLPYYFRVIYFLRSWPPFFNNFLGVEFSHLTMKISCLLQPLAYIITSETFRNHAISSVTGVNPSKKNA